MKKQNRNAFILFISGSLFVSFAQMARYYTEVPDFLYGSLSGVGIGLLILVLIRFQKINSVKEP